LEEQVWLKLTQQLTYKNQKKSFPEWHPRHQNENQHPIDLKPSHPEKNTILTPEEGFRALLHHLNLTSQLVNSATANSPNPSHFDLSWVSLKNPKPKSRKWTSSHESRYKAQKNSVHRVNIAIDKLWFTASAIPVQPMWIQLSSKKIVITYSYEMELHNNWYHAHICVHTGKLLSLIDWVSDASYEVYPVGVNDPDDGKRALIRHPFNSEASPNGWVKGRSTAGNNVLAQENLKGEPSPVLDQRKDMFSHYSPQTGHKQKFRFDLDLSQDPNNYLDAAITQLFYTNNLLHDLFYHYGFTEVSGNFQIDNFGRGGQGGDPIMAFAQDGSGFNNANFAAPPDGKIGKMRMFVWNTIEPNRDGDLENGIVIHEFSHGVSTRLTGGPWNSGCLAWGEAGGMGEGWGDVWATILRMRNSKMASRNYPIPWEMGKYANGGKKGIRNYVYSSDKNLNPSTYSLLNGPNYWGVHAKGEVWAITLLEVYWNLVDYLGFTPDWQHDQPLSYGNTLFFQLVIDGLKLQPCRPSFLDARDSILQAEQVLTLGSNSCTLWKGFAKRGLGINAKRIPGSVPWEDDTRVDGFEIPTACL
jgi:extracellular elastinolytic metalloproteinase